MIGEVPSDAGTKARPNPKPPLRAIPRRKIALYSLSRSMWTVFAGTVHVLAALPLAWWRGFFLGWKHGLENSKTAPRCVAHFWNAFAHLGADSCFCGCRESYAQREDASRRFFTMNGSTFFCRKNKPAQRVTLCGIPVYRPLSGRKPIPG